MKKLALLIVFGLVSGALAGCGSSTPTAPMVGSNQTTVPGTPEDRAAVVSAADLHPEFMDDGVYVSAATMSNQAQGVGGRLSTEAVITPITFQRRVRVSERSFEFAFSDTDSTGRPRSAILTVHKVLTGTLSILAADTTGGFNPPVRISKPLSETWTRKLQFARVDTTSGGGGHGHGDGDGDDDGDDHDDDIRGGIAGQTGILNAHGGGHPNRSRWVLVGVSAILVDTPDGATHISSLHFVATGLDTTISEPLNLISVGSLPILPPGTQVTITASTNASDDIVLLLSRDRRFRLASNGDNTYTGSFTVPTSTGPQHFGIDVLSHDTLYDDTAAYDSETWLLPAKPGRGSLLSAN